MSSFPPPPPPARPKSTPIWKRWWFWVVVVVVILIAGSAAGLIAAGTGTSQTEQTEAEGGSPSPVITATPTPSPTAAPVVMPDLVGLSVPDALQVLEPLGILTIGETTGRPSRQPEGTVLRQVPPAGTELSDPTFVTVVFAEPFPRVPNVIGKTLANARRTLKNAGFEVGKVTQQTSSKRKGMVISQSPDGGTSARPGRSVSLVTAKPAPAPASTT